MFYDDGSETTFFLWYLEICRSPAQVPFLDIHRFQRQIFEMQAENTCLGDLLIGS